MLVKKRTDPKVVVRLVAELKEFMPIGGTCQSAHRIIVRGKLQIHWCPKKKGVIMSMSRKGTAAYDLPIKTKVNNQSPVQSRQQVI